MTLFQKQVYEANFNYLGQQFIKFYDSSNGDKRKQISEFIKALNQMYIHTNQLSMQIDILEKKLSIERQAKLRAVESLRKLREDE